MSNWVIRSKKTKGVLKTRPFPDRDIAEQYIWRMGQTLGELYEAYYVGPGGEKGRRMINEGLIPHDLDNILLPKISVDEYLPSDNDTENVVVAFFLKGVPEAVIPFKDFCSKFNGVVDVDYGDSDTIPNTSIVYVEFDRETVDIKDLDKLIQETTRLTEFTSEDYTVTFPHTNAKFPYKPKLVSRYFKSRDRRENYLAQKRAQKRAEQEQQVELDQKQQDNTPPEDVAAEPQPVANEDLALAMSNLLFEDDLGK